MMRLVGVAALCIGLLELGFVLLVAGFLPRGEFVLWSGGWCLLLSASGARAAARGKFFGASE